MKFEEIDNLSKEDLPVKELIEGEIEIDKDVELENLKTSLKREQLHVETKSLVDNNCATIVAFPEANCNHAIWIKENILDCKDVDLAIMRLKEIQAKEVEIANYVAPPSAKEVIIAKIKAEKSPTVAKLHGLLQELIEVI